MFWFSGRARDYSATPENSSSLITMAKSYWLDVKMNQERLSSFEGIKSEKFGLYCNISEEMTTVGKETCRVTFRLQRQQKQLRGDAASKPLCEAEGSLGLSDDAVVLEAFSGATFQPPCLLRAGSSGYEHATLNVIPWLLASTGQPVRISESSLVASATVPQYLAMGDLLFTTRMHGLRLAHAKCSLPHDKVYRVFRLFSSSISSIVTIDYSRQVAEVIAGFSSAVSEWTAVQRLSKCSEPPHVASHIYDSIHFPSYTLTLQYITNTLLF